MKIIKISKDKKGLLYNILFNNGEIISVDEQVIIDEGLLYKNEVTPELYIKLEELSELSKLYFVAINYLSYRMRAIKEVRTHLLKKEYDDSDIEIILDRLIKEKILDDKLFAISLVRTKVNTTTKGYFQIKKELEELEIDPFYIEEAMTEYLEELEVEKIKKEIVRKERSNRSHSAYFLKGKIKEQLIQKGYRAYLVDECLKEITFSKDNEHIFLEKELNKQHTKLKRKYKGNELKIKIKNALYQKGFSLDSVDELLNKLK